MDKEVIDIIENSFENIEMINSNSDDDIISAINENRNIKIGNSSDALTLMTLIDKIYSFSKRGKKNEG